MISRMYGGRELTAVGEHAAAGDLISTDRRMRDAQGRCWLVTTFRLGEPVASDVHSREPLFDLGTCEHFGGFGA